MTTQSSTQSDQSLLCTQWVAKDPRFLHADSIDSDQNGQMPRLIRDFAGRTDQFVGFVVLWLIAVSLFSSVFLSEGLYMEPSQVADNENGGLAHMKDTKVFTENLEIGCVTNVLDENTVIFLSFRTDRYWQTVQTQIRLLLEER